jgi:tetratricopeptide (TPR) repeat protein
MNEESSETLYKHAQALMDVDRPRDAIPLLHKALAGDPQNSHYLCSLSSAHHNLKEYTEALTWAERALGIAPDEEWGHRLRSRCLCRLGHPQEALVAAQEAVRLSPDTYSTLLELGNALTACQQFLHAEQVTMRLLAIAPDTSLAFILLAAININLQRWPRAEWAARKALALDPVDTEALRLLIRALEAQKKGEEAFHYTIARVQLAPTDERARITLGSHFILFQFLSVMCLFPVLWLLLVVCGIRGGISFSVAFALTMGFGASLYRFFPSALLMCQPKFRKLPLQMRASLIAEEQRDWLRSTILLLVMMSVLLILLAVAIIAAIVL